ncbi:hypothetical protein Bbelb_204150 [Branchiostoma belcheri]|nr:hypothetical protein Bbelb_204150 [Branchiostoma belcheri]
MCLVFRLTDGKDCHEKAVSAMRPVKEGLFSLLKRIRPHFCFIVHELQITSFKFKHHTKAYPVIFDDSNRNGGLDHTKAYPVIFDDSNRNGGSDYTKAYPVIFDDSNRNGGSVNNFSALQFYITSLRARSPGPVIRCSPLTQSPNGTISSNHAADRSQSRLCVIAAKPQYIRRGCAGDGSGRTSDSPAGRVNKKIRPKWGK